MNSAITGCRGLIRCITMLILNILQYLKLQNNRVHMILSTK
nr:MAG TPA: hypothetical protein [Caudoviricetes sp.]